MTAVLLFVILVCCLMAGFFFQCSMLLCIIGFTASAALLAVQVFLFKESKLKRILMPIFCFVLLCFCMLIPIQPTGCGYYNYSGLLEDFANAQLSDKTDRSQEKLDEITQRYGETDDLKYIMALKAFDRNALDEAEKIADSFTDNRSENYYTIKERVIATKHEFSDDLADMLIDLYEDAAEDNPDWTHALKSLGAVLMDEEKYEKATYYLLKAYETSEEPDGETAYYLGVALIEQGKFSEGFSLFEEAMDIGVDEDIQANIAWYIQQATGEE